MRPLEPIERDHEDLYLSCVGQTGNVATRQMLEDMAPRIVAAGHDYVTEVGNQSAERISPIDLEDAERDEISKVYDSRLVSKSGIERATYDKIKTLTAYCPYCGFGEVWEIDHYLPQGQFPELNVLPQNLVPICHPCNHTKLTSRPEGANRSLLHPYFDRLPNERWLFAELDVTHGGPVLQFYVQLAEAHGVLGQRLGYHFEKLNLPKRMRERSAKVLSEIEFDVEDSLDQLGPEGLSQHFKAEGVRIFRHHGNTLEAAAYFAAAENNEYCSGAYRN